jgi:hypothetical protein
MKIFYIIIEFPLSIARDLTIPPVDLEKWNRKIFIIHPITCSLFMLVVLNRKYVLTPLVIPVAIDNYIFFSVYFGIMIIVSIIIAKFTYRNRLPGLMIVSNIPKIASVSILIHYGCFLDMDDCKCPSRLVKPLGRLIQYSNSLPRNNTT